MLFLIEMSGVLPFEVRKSLVRIIIPFKNQIFVNIKGTVKQMVHILVNTFLKNKIITHYSIYGGGSRKLLNSMLNYKTNMQLIKLDIYRKQRRHEIFPEVGSKNRESLANLESLKSSKIVSFTSLKRKPVYERDDFFKNLSLFLIKHTL